MKAERNFLIGAGLLAAFVVWTFMVMNVDVQNVGQQGTAVGFAGFNTWFHKLTGVHMWIYIVTDWLGLVPIAICMCFAVLGFIQLIRRKSLFKVDLDIILLGVYYILVISGYLIFEMIPINYRPIPIDGIMENKQPSFLDLLLEAHIGLERQGPGSRETIEKALGFMGDLSRFESVADLGCGTGGQTLTLAEHLSGSIVGLDMFPAFAEELDKRAKDKDLQGRVKGVYRRRYDL